MSNTTLHHVVGRRTDTLRHNRHFAGHRGERNSIKPRSATKPKGPVQLGNPIIRAFMQVQLNVGRRYLSLEHTAHSPMYNRHCTNLHHDLGDSHHMNARNARHKILPHLWYVGLKTASSRWRRAALSPTTTPPLVPARKTQRSGATFRRAVFSAKEVPSAQDLSPRAQTHLPFGCSVVGVM